MGNFDFCYHFVGTVLLYCAYLDKLGKGIVLRELIAFHCCFICLYYALARLPMVYDRKSACTAMGAIYACE